MGKERTDSSKYPSRYAPNKWITPAQYITELICEKKAQKDKKDLPIEFWKLPEWRKFFQQQVLAANGLLKIYDVKAIIRALNNKNAWSIYSLRAPHLDDLIKAEQRLLEIEQEKMKDSSVERQSVVSKPREQIVKKNTLSKLRDIDNE